jgi:histidine phosphotransfer protein HptB
VPDDLPAPAEAKRDAKYPAKDCEPEGRAADPVRDERTEAPAKAVRHDPSTTNVTEIERPSIGHDPIPFVAEPKASTTPAPAAGGKLRRPAPIPISTLINAASGAGLDDTIPVLDEGRLEASCMGRDDLRALLVRTFLGTAQQRIARIGECLSGNDSKGVEFEAHGMKGMCLTLGAARCGRLFSEIERMGREGKLEGMLPLLNRVRVEATKAENELSRFDVAA